MASEDNDPEYYSMVVIMGYMQWLVENGVISEGPWKLADKGQNFLALCEEFDWRPDASDIGAFVSEFVQEDDKFEIARMLFAMSNDPHGFKKVILDLKNKL